MAREQKQGTSSAMCSKKMLGQTTRRLQDDLIIDEILTRLPPPAVGRCRAVCRAWHTALTSADFVRAYGAASSAAAARQPELLFFAPAVAGTATGTTLYTCALRNNGEAPSAARELLTLGNLSAAHAVVSPRPCHGLTLVSDGPAAQHYVCNLSTGEHVALPPCERAAVGEPMRAGVASRCLRPPPWTPFETASTGLGFDPATGEHKVVRLFRRRIGETACEVCSTPAMAMARRWRPCAGRVPAPAASFVPGLPPVYLAGCLYWLLELDSFTGADQPVMSFSVGAERFGRAAPMPPSLARRVDTLTELDGSLCAVVDLRFDHESYSLYTWGGGAGAGGDTCWSKRYSIDLRSLPPAISDEFVEEDDVIPLCSCGGGGDKKLLLATGFHKVFAYNPGRVAMERVLCLQEFVDVPPTCQEARLLLHFGLYQDSIAGVGGGNDDDDSSRLQVKRGTNTVCKRQVAHVYRKDSSRKMRDFLKDYRKKIAGQMNNSWSRYGGLYSSHTTRAGGT